MFDSVSIYSFLLGDGLHCSVTLTGGVCRRGGSMSPDTAENPLNLRRFHCWQTKGSMLGKICLLKVLAVIVVGQSVTILTKNGKVV